MKDNRDLMVIILMILSAVLMIAAFAGWYLVFSLVTVLACIAYGALGVYKRGSLGSLGPVLAVVGAVMLGAFIAMFALWKPGQAPVHYVLGFPPATAVLVYVIWLFPAVLGILYAVNFKRCVLSEEEFEKIRAFKETAGAPETVLGDVNAGGKSIGG